MTRAQKLGITEFPYKEFNDDGYQNYYEDSNGFWWSCKHNRNNETYLKNSSGEWVRNEYDDYDNRTYHEISSGDWYRKIFDESNMLISYEDHQGNYWTNKMSDECPYLDENLSF